jgi:hypothetical protein
VLQLEEVLQRSRERHKHLAQQLEELAGCDSGSDAVDTSDLQRQLQASPCIQHVPAHASYNKMT